MFDRLFGTFAEAPRGEPLDYGLGGTTPSLNPLRIALAEWIAMARDIGRAGDARSRLRVAFGRP